MFANIRLVISTLLVILNTALTSFIISFFAVIKFILPFPFVKKLMVSMANKTLWCWATLNLWMLNINNTIDWVVDGGGNAISRKVVFIVI